MQDLSSNIKFFSIQTFLLTLSVGLWLSYIHSLVSRPSAQNFRTVLVQPLSIWKDGKPFVAPHSCQPWVRPTGRENENFQSCSTTRVSFPEDIRVHRYKYRYWYRAEMRDIAAIEFGAKMSQASSHHSQFMPKNILDRWRFRPIIKTASWHSGPNFHFQALYFQNMSALEHLHP